jgi:hypothetical protein
MSASAGLRSLIDDKAGTRGTAAKARARWVRAACSRRGSVLGTTARAGPRTAADWEPVPEGSAGGGQSNVPEKPPRKTRARSRLRRQASKE